jgi:bacteriorhodopsin
MEVNNDNFSQDKARKLAVLYGVPMVFVGCMTITLVMKQSMKYEWWIFGFGATILMLASYLLGRFIHKKAKH